MCCARARCCAASQCILVWCHKCSQLRAPYVVQLAGLPLVASLGLNSLGHVCRSGAEQLMECWLCWLTAEVRVNWRMLWCTCLRAQQAKVRHVPAACCEQPFFTLLLA